MSEDVRWKQRFDNYTKALETLRQAKKLADQRELSDLEKQRVVQDFEFTYELGWKVLKDYLEEQGIIGIIGSKNAVREAFKNGLIEDGETWMEMIKARNLSPHTYNQDTAEEIAEAILSRFHFAFEQFTKRFSNLIKQDRHATA